MAVSFLFHFSWYFVFSFWRSEVYGCVCVCLQALNSGVSVFVLVCVYFFLFLRQNCFVMSGLSSLFRGLLVLVAKWD